jgi:capsular polysaccharide biosynthesis protein
MLALLPPNFKRVYEKDPSVTYRTFMHAIPIFEDTALPQSYPLIRTLFKNSCASNKNPNLRIYVQRVPTKEEDKRRTFVNERDVTDCMEMLGFKIVRMEELSVAEQIRLFSEASVIVSAHGAALAYTVFCHAGTKIVEIYRPSAKPRRHYMHIASCLNLNFTRFSHVTVCDANENMNVNVHELYKVLAAD